MSASTSVPGGTIVIPGGNGTLTIKFPRQPYGYRITAVRLVLTMDATVGTRIPVLQVLRGAPPIGLTGGEVVYESPQLGVPNDQIVPCSWFIDADVAEFAAGGTTEYRTAPLPRLMVLDGNDEVRFTLVDGEVGDVISEVAMRIAPSGANDD